ncbi:biotin-dependent carboxyltransferase family protein [Chryseoglobus sp. 28M-23]|uniref:5-oxoprolinase subunit C family protein n=1 Tax=Chryseoglobus sp. 28M-23 TaxID=2772253 RepID=UPI0017473B63|nr:biotin-dependent carboxyltransferase family protein [Chryseoglobus sp. 28M-23]QOD94787.1 biotin-dependent carboxyltransferase family protein [Chryseoglobus sp. 28M-23]
MLSPDALASSSAAHPVVRVLAVEGRALVQDLGRVGLAHLGVSGSGAFDRAAHRLANRLVGNPEHAAALEVLLGGVRLALPAGCWLTVTGAWGPVTLEGERLEPHTAVRTSLPCELALGPATHGVRYTVAVRGGLAVAETLGSRSRDTLAALGPAPLAAGDELPIGPEPDDLVPPADRLPVDPPTTGLVELDVRPGPRLEWLTAGARELLLGVVWQASARSDRTGVRLEGPRLDLARHGELASEGMLRGSIQISPDGAPTILGPDHPVTGGYPVALVVTEASLDRLAQLRPGQPVRLHLVAGRP